MKKDGDDGGGFGREEEEGRKESEVVFTWEIKMQGFKYMWYNQLGSPLVKDEVSHIQISYIFFKPRMRVRDRFRIGLGCKLRT